MSAAGPPEDHGFAEALRDGLDAGDAPVPSLLGVQRRAEARRRRQVLGSVAAVAAVVAVALGVALVVPGAAGEDGQERPADVADGPVGDAPVTGTAADFTDPAVWPLLPRLPVTSPLLTAEDLAAALPGSGAWSPAVADYDGSWHQPMCLDPRLSGPPPDPAGAPADQSVLVWVAGAPDDPSATGYATVEVYRWSDGGGAGSDLAAAWGLAQVADAPTCGGEVFVDAAGVPGADAVVSVAPPAAGGAEVDVPVRPDEDAWSVRASTTGGPTALRLEASVTADTAEQAAARAAALLTRLVERITAADAAVIDAARRPLAAPAPGEGSLRRGRARSGAAAARADANLA